MAVESKLQFGSVVSFDTYPASILGTIFSEVKVLGIFDKDTANMWIDANSMHSNVYPSLPVNSPTSPDDYQYVKLKHTNGNISVLGLPWIREDTIVVVNKGTLTLVLSDMTVEDKDNIVASIAAIGYKLDRITLE